MSWNRRLRPGSLDHHHPGPPPPKIKRLQHRLLGTLNIDDHEMDLKTVPTSICQDVVEPSSRNRDILNSPSSTLMFRTDIVQEGRQSSTGDLMQRDRPTRNITDRSLDHHIPRPLRPLPNGTLMHRINRDSRPATLIERVRHRVGNRIIRPNVHICLLYTSPSPRDGLLSRMPSSA